MNVAILIGLIFDRLIVLRRKLKLSLFDASNIVTQKNIKFEIDRSLLFISILIISLVIISLFCAFCKCCIRGQDEVQAFKWKNIERDF